MKKVYETFQEFKQILENKPTINTETFYIGDAEYSMIEKHPITIHEMMSSKPFITLYQASKGPLIGISWKLTENTISVHCVEYLPFINRIIHERQDNIIGDTVEVKFALFQNIKPIRGKVDTGADVCSLHATKWSINNGRVSFVAPHISTNTLTAPLVDNQAVKSADGGIEYRPVVEFDISINGKDVNKIAFNLNDRSEMQFPILIGQNALERGKFLVNPSANESVNWKELEDYFRSKE